MLPQYVVGVEWRRLLQILIRIKISPIIASFLIFLIA